MFSGVFFLHYSEIIYKVALESKVWFFRIARHLDLMNLSCKQCLPFASVHNIGFRTHFLQLARATVNNVETGEMEPAEYRISKK